MKKYVKPELFYESFELSQNIAACGWDLNSADIDNCRAYYDATLDGIVSSGYYIFNTVATCDSVADKEQYCYMPGASTDEFIKVYQS